jgi:mannan endo-1,4-beta-mannosidase
LAFWDGQRWTPLQRSRRSSTSDESRTVAWIATAIIVIGLLGMLLPRMVTDAATPRLTLTPATAAAGATITVQGSGFAPRMKLQLTFDGASAWMPTATANGKGLFKTRLEVPSASDGTHTIAAVLTLQARGKSVVEPTGTVLAAVQLLVGPAATASPVPSATPIDATPTPRATPTATTTPTGQPSVPPPSASPTPAPTAAADGFVTRRGRQLLLEGQSYRFTGLNMYNINSLNNCGYTIPDLDAELDAVSQAGILVRGWFYQGLAVDQAGQGTKRDWSTFDATLAELAAHNMKVVVQLSGQGGDCRDYPVETYKTEAWYADGYRRPEASGVSYYEWVREVVSRYRNNPTVAWWQLMGEPEAGRGPGYGGACSSTAAGTLKAWADDTAALVKSIDRNHLVAIGVIGTGQCGAVFHEYDALHAGSDIDLCTVEDYGSPADPLPGDIWNGMEARIATCAALDKPIYVQESGIKGTEVGGDLDLRASYLDAKLAAQFAAGIAGEIIWAWRSAGDGGSSTTSYDIGPKDPAMTVIRRYR